MMKAIITVIFMVVCLQAQANIPSSQIAHLLGTNRSLSNEQAPARSIAPTLKILKKNYEFVVFFKSTCPHCHRFIPILKDFATYYGIHISAYSVDGPDLDDLHAKKLTSQVFWDYYVQGHFRASVPGLFLKNIHTDQVYAVLFGEAKPEQLARRMSGLLAHIKKAQGGL